MTLDLGLASMDILFLLFLVLQNDDAGIKKESRWTALLRNRMDGEYFFHELKNPEAMLYRHWDVFYAETDFCQG